MPKITVFLRGNSATLTEPDLAALKVGFLDKLQAASDETFNRSNIVVVLSSDDPFLAKALFKPGSGVGISEAHAITAAIQYEGSLVTLDVGTKQYEIVYALANHAELPQTEAPTPAPAPLPTPLPTRGLALTLTPTPAPTCAAPTCLVARDYCPVGYHDYGMRFDWSVGRITVVGTHQACADRCTQFSGPRFNGGCKGYMTGMYTGMVFCRAYGGEGRSAACAPWAVPWHKGYYSGELGKFHFGSGQLNIGGNCCSNTSFVDRSRLDVQYDGSFTGGVPKITVFLRADLSPLTEQERAALMVGVLDTLQSGSNETFNRSKIVVVLSESDPIKAEAFFKAGSGVNIAEAHAIVAAIQYEGSMVTSDGGGAQYIIVHTVAGIAEPPQTGTPTLAPTQRPSPAPSFSPAVAGAVPTVTAFLRGNSATMTEPELSAIKAGFLDKLQAASHEIFTRSQIVVVLSSDDPFQAKAFFLPGYGVGIAEAHAIAAAIQYEGSAVTFSGGGTQYAIVYALGIHAVPPQTGTPTPAPTLRPSPAPTPSPSPAPSFSPAVAGAVPKVAVFLRGNAAALTETELAALKAVFLDKLQAALGETFNRSKIVVVMSSDDPFQAQAFFRPGSGVSISEAHAIAATIQYAGSVITPDGGVTQYGIIYALANHRMPPPTGTPTLAPTPPLAPSASPSPAPSFSPAIEGAVPKITVFLRGNSATLTEPDLAALKVGFLDRLQAASDATFHRSNIVVVLSSDDPFQAEAFFRPGSGVDITEAHAIAAAVQYPGSAITPDGGGTQYEIIYALANQRVPQHTLAPTLAPTASPSPAPSFSPAVEGAVPSITVLFRGNAAMLAAPELAALKVGFLNKLQAASDETFNRSKIVVVLSSSDPFQAEALFRPGSAVGIAQAHAIAAAIQYEGSMVTSDGGETQYEIVYAVANFEKPPQTLAPTPALTASPSPAPSFSPAIEGAVPSITVILRGNSATLTEPERAALKVGFLDKLQAASDETFNRSNIVVVLSSDDPFQAKAFLRPGSGVGISEANAIAAIIQHAGSVITPDGGGTQYSIVYAVANWAGPPQTMTPTPAPTASPSSAPSFSPAVTGAVPKITVLLRGNSATLTDPELVALKVGFLDKLQAGSEEAFDRSKIVVELSSDDPFQAAAFFRPGSGIHIAEAHAIAAAILYDGSVITRDGGGTLYEIIYALVNHAQPPQTKSPTPAPTVNPSSAPSFSPAVSGAVPKVTVLLRGNSATLADPELDALKVGFLDKLQAGSDETFDRSKIVVELSSNDPFQAEAFFKAGSGVGIAAAHAIAAATQYEGSMVILDGGGTQYEIVYAVANHAQPPQTMPPTLAPTLSPTLAPSFSPAVAGKVPKMTVLLRGYPAATLLAALKVGFLDKLQAASDETFDWSKIVVELAPDDVFQAETWVEAFFKPGSGIDYPEAHAIAAAIQYEDSVVTADGGVAEYMIMSVFVNHAEPPQTVGPTISPTTLPTGHILFTTPTVAPVTTKPSVAPATVSMTLTTAPTAAPTCFPTTTLVTSDYCPCGYHDYGVRYSQGLGRITIVRTHQECADRCTTFSGSQFMGGCRGFMTGMYMNMLFCRSYGSNVRTTACPFWAIPQHPGQFSGPLGTVRPRTNQVNVGGNCCSNTTFVDVTGDS